WIPELSFLPKPQSDGRDLPGQCQERHVGVDTAIEALLVEILQRAVFVSGGRRRALEHVLEDGVVIAIQATRERCSPAPANRTGHHLVASDRARARDGTDVGPG